MLINKHLILIKCSTRQNYETQLSNSDKVVLEVNESYHRIQQKITNVFILKTTEKYNFIVRCAKQTGKVTISRITFETNLSWQESNYILFRVGSLQNLHLGAWKLRCCCSDKNWRELNSWNTDRAVITNVMSCPYFTPYNVDDLSLSSFLMLESANKSNS